MLFDALELEHVILRGRVTTVILNPRHPSPEYEAEYLNVIRAHEASVDWTLDISEAVGKVTLRGHNAELVRRNPATQALVRQENVSDGKWRALDMGVSEFEITLNMLSERGWANTILCADETRKDIFESQLRVLDALRAEGIADQE